MIKSAGLFMVLIILPSLLLAYLSVNAIQAERVAYRQRITEGYNGLGRFVTRELNEQVKDIGDRWLEECDPESLLNLSEQERESILSRLSHSESLITEVYLVSNIGNVLHPIDLREFRSGDSTIPDDADAPQFDEWVSRFQALSEKAEDREFEENDPDAAAEIYRKISETYPIPRLRAIALGELARINMLRSDWEKAYQYNRQIIENYPQVRDFNNLHLRFNAQYQAVVTLENMNRWGEAMPTLLSFYQDLLDHSDEVNRIQYEYFVERIQRLFQRIIGVYDATEQPQFRASFTSLQDQKKKNIGTKYLVEKLYQRLGRGILKRDKFRSRIKYFSDFAAEQSYLVGYLLLAKSEKRVVEAALGFQINIDALKQEIFPRIMEKEEFPEDVVIAVLDEEQKMIMGDSEEIFFEPMAQVPLREPLDFWNLAIFPTLDNPLVNEGSSGLYLKLWGIFLLWLFIMIGSAVFIYRMRQQRRQSLQKSTFISSVSHELRTPLTSIKMFVDFLTRNEHLKKEPETQRYLRIIRGESERLLRLVENVLDYSKIERGVKKYRFEYEEVEAVVRSVVDMFSYHAESQGVAIELDIQGMLPEIVMDRHAITQALINLLSNAVKYSTDKHPVKMTVFPNGKYLNIEVQDRGVGIKAEDLNHIFEDYYRAKDDTAANIAGTGLGLPMVKHIVSSHKGEVNVSSVYGEGSTFTIKLPLE